MTARIIDGKALAREVEAQARARSEALASRPGGRRPGLAVVLVGEDPAASEYRSAENVQMFFVFSGSSDFSLLPCFSFSFFLIRSRS